MFRLFQYQNEVRREVTPENGIYTVRELTDYTFEYEGATSASKFNHVVFVEDMPIEQSWYVVEGNKIKSKKNKFFQDYFGFAALTINGDVFKLNIQIEKLKSAEIEGIFMFLWKNENRLFHNFFSKSSVTARIDKEGAEFGLTSKFLLFVKKFYNTFSKLLIYFKSNPHTAVRTKREIVDYSPQAVTGSTIDWLLTNLDNVNFDNSLQGFPNSIKIENFYGYIDKIETEKSTATVNVYENQIILGAFQSIIKELRRFKADIGFKADIDFDEEDFGKGGYIDFRDLKKIPFLKLFDDAKSLEIKLLKLSAQYKHIFDNTIAKDEAPRLTAVFSNKSHYRSAYKVIRESKERKFNFDGELQLLNIKKLSQLYEAYNFFQIINNFSDCIDNNFFERVDDLNEPDGIPLREDGLPSRVSFISSSCTINIYYELRYPNKLGQTLLARIDTIRGGIYKPDYVVELDVKGEKTYCIIDSKYTRRHTLLQNHLPSCIGKYIIDTGIRGYRYRKVDYLVMLYPGDEKEVRINNPDYSPQIISLPSKPKSEEYLNEFIAQLVKNQIPNQLLSDKMRKE